MNTISPSRYLMIVRGTIEKYGLAKNSFGSEDRGFCMIGAINHAYGSNYSDHSPERNKVRTTVCNIVQDLLPQSMLDVEQYSYRSLVQFNDHPNTTKDDVLRLLGRAIVIAFRLEGRESLIT